MKSFEEGLIVRLGNAIEKIEQLERDIFSVKTIEDSHKAERLLYSAMIADISEKLFGEQATKAPKYLANVHCGWACGPGSKKEGECYVEAFYRMRKEVKPGDWIDEWKEFLGKNSVA